MRLQRVHRMRSSMPSSAAFCRLYWPGYGEACRECPARAPTYQDTEANARAKMLIYLLENGLTNA